MASHLFLLGHPVVVKRVNLPRLKQASLARLKRVSQVAVICQLCPPILERWVTQAEKWAGRLNQWLLRPLARKRCHLRACPRRRCKASSALATLCARRVVLESHPIMWAFVSLVLFTVLDLKTPWPSIGENLRCR